VRWDFWYPSNCKFNKESSSKKILKSVKNWQNYGHESVTPFFGAPCTHCLLVCGDAVMTRSSSLLLYHAITQSCTRHALNAQVDAICTSTSSRLRTDLASLIHVRCWRPREGCKAELSYRRSRPRLNSHWSRADSDTKITHPRSSCKARCLPAL